MTNELNKAQPKPADMEPCRVIERLQQSNAELLEALEAQEMAECDPQASRRKGYFDHARELRKAAIANARRQL
jgi:hypothetical protein